ncbi:MAG: cysteine hydrolase [Actinobacteria bacterium]|nr:cysteine hydrolase [Actinomycetota bacterium]
MTEGTALLVIDMIYDFVEPEGALNVPAARGILPAVSELIEEARAAGVPVIYLNDSHDLEDKEFENWPKHAISGTKGAEVVKEVAPLATDHVVEKKHFSAFYRTSLESILKEYGISRLIITGTVTNICVLFTAFDAAMRDYEVVVFRNAVAGLDEGDHEFALRQIEKVIGGTVI